MKRKIKKILSYSHISQFLINKGLEGLAQAIIMQAAIDYENLRRAQAAGKTRHVYSGHKVVDIKWELLSIEKFFNNDCNGYIENGKEIFTLLKKHIEENLSEQNPKMKGESN